MLKIGDVSQVTGIPPHLIRIWEERYGTVLPRRTNGGRRLYNRSDVERLKLVKKAVENENAISFVSKLGLKDIKELSKPSIKQSGRSKPVRSVHEDGGKTYYKDALSAIEGLDFYRLENVLTRSAIKLTRISFLEFLVLPLIRDLRSQLAKGKIGIVQERMTTTMMQSILFGLLQIASVPEKAQKIIITSPSSAFGELAALSVALIASETGCKPMYIGINIPSKEIEAVAAASQSELVGIGITQSTDIENTLRKLQRLRAHLELPMFVLDFEKGVSRFENQMKPMNIYFSASLDDLRRDLNAYITGEHIDYLG